MIRDRAVATRYAHALFGAALKTRGEEAVLADFQSLELLYERDMRFQHFLEAPDVLSEHKEALIRDVLGGRVNDLVVRFVLLMLRKKRIQHLPLAFEHYRELVEDHMGILRARVVTAVPLAHDLAEALARKLEVLTAKKVRLDARVEPGIVGGIIVTAGEKTIDGSIRHRLQELREALLAVRVH